MMSSHATLRSLLFLTLASACSSSDDGIWFPAEDPGGKADAFATIKGSDIPSQFVDSSKSYLIARRHDRLVDVGALNMIEARLVTRIDGIIANMPVDGKIHLAELVRMEDPAILDSLFPEEVAALPQLWKTVEAPSTTTFVIGPDASFGVLDAATPPGPAVPPANLAISSLATELQSAATRLQNVYDADNNTSTVQLADLDNGIANPAAFTPGEITAFGTIKAIFREKAVAVTDAELIVSPGPGPFAIDATVGPVTLKLAGTTRFDEERQHATHQMILVMTATQTLAATADMPMDAKVLVIDKTSANEAAFGSGAVPGLNDGHHVFEVWQAGQRVFSTTAVLPTTTRTQKLELTDKLDYTLIAGLTPLVRNTVSATFAGSTAVAKFSYDKTAIPPTGTLNQSALARTTTPKVTLPIGRYTFVQQGLALHIYPNNVLWLVRNGQSFRLLPSVNGNTNPTTFHNPQLNAEFNASNNQLFVQSPSLNVTLNASMRDI